MHLDEQGVRDSGAGNTALGSDPLGLLSVPERESFDRWRSKSQTWGRDRPGVSWWVGPSTSWTLTAVSQPHHTQRCWLQPHFVGPPSYPGSQSRPPDFFSFVLIPDTAHHPPTGLHFRGWELGPDPAPGIQAFKCLPGRRLLKK